MNDKTASILLKSVRIIFGIILTAIFYALVIYGISRLCTYAYDFSYQVFGNVSYEEAPGTDIDIKISKGESIMSVATKLEQKKLIVNKYSFYLRAKLSIGGKTGLDIQPGTYELNTSMTYADILNNITAVGEPESDKKKDKGQ